MSSLFYRNPRLTLLIIMLILVSGLSAWFTLPRLEDPMLSSRFATITTQYSGAGPERVESQVTERIEEELKGIEELKLVNSTSASEVSIILLELDDLVTNMDAAWADVRAKLDDVRLQLPIEASEPFFEVLDTRAFAMIVGLSWAGEGNPNYAILRRRAEDLQTRLLTIDNTEEVKLFGGPDEEIIVEIDPSQLVSLGLSTADIARQLSASDAKVSAGQLRSERNNLLIEVSNDLKTIQRIRNTPIHFGENGDFVCLSDLADVRKGIRHPMTERALLSGKPGIALSAYVLDSQRVDLWTRKVREELDRYAFGLPSDLSLEVLFDQSVYTEERLSGLVGNLATGGLIVVAVVFLLMGWRSAILVGVTLPLTVLMVLAGMKLVGIPIHQMSVTGLIIALGMLIDNAIVMVDEVGRELKAGHSPTESISLSVRKLAVPLLGSTLTTILAFLPIALMSGGAGEFVGSIAFSVILSLVSSLFLALTIVPALSGFLRGGDRVSSGREFMNNGFANRRLSRGYHAMLRGLFARPWRCVGLGVVLPVMGFVVGTTLPEQFFPPADRDQFHIQLEMPAQTPIERTEQIAQEVRDQLRKRSIVQDTHWFVGRSAPPFYYNLASSRKFSPEFAQALVQLNTSRGALELIREVQHDLDRSFPEARVLVRQLEQGPASQAPVEVRFYGPDLEVLRRLGREARQKLTQIEHVLHTRSSLAECRPKIGLSIREEQIRLSGLNNREVARQIDTTLEGAVGGSIIEQTEELPLRIRVADDVRSRLDRIRSLELLPPKSEHSMHWMPLTSVADVQLTSEVSAINRRHGRRVNLVQGFITAGVLPSEVRRSYEAELSTFLDNLPPGYSFDWGGEASKRDDAIGNLMSSVMVLIVLMVATLVLSFSSFRMAAIIGFVGFLSIGLGMLALKLFGYPFGFMAIVGSMGLVGIAINDSIVVLTAIRSNPRSLEGEPEGVAQVVVEETRHVLATTFTTMAGFIPLLLAGGGFWPPMAITIAGGVLGATVLALFLVPSVYIIATYPYSPLNQQASLDKQDKASSTYSSRTGKQPSELETVPL